MFHFYHAVAIISCGVAGAYLAWAVVDAFGWSGVGAAVATAFIAMLAATLMWAGGVALGKALRRLE
jgi:beta-lactamase class A